MFKNCLSEMELSEQVLSSKWTKLSQSGNLSNRKHIDKLFIKLKDRQTITSAALQAINSYSTLKEEKDEIKTRERRLYSFFQKWIEEEKSEKNEEVEEGDDEEFKIILKTYKELRKLTKILLQKWTQISQADKRVNRELEALNSSLANLPQKLKNMKATQLDQVRWPTSQCKKVSNAVELAFDQISFMRTLLSQIDERLEELELVFQNSNRTPTNYVQNQNDDDDESD